MAIAAAVATVPVAAQRSHDRSSIRSHPATRVTAAICDHQARKCRSLRGTSKARNLVEDISEQRTAACHAPFEIPHGSRPYIDEVIAIDLKLDHLVVEASREHGPALGIGRVVDKSDRDAGDDIVDDPDPLKIDKPSRENSGTCMNSKGFFAAAGRI